MIKEFLKKMWNRIFTPTVEFKFVVDEATIISAAQKLATEIMDNPWGKYYALMEVPPIFDRGQLIRRVREVADKATRILRDKKVNKVVSYLDGEVLKRSPSAILKYICRSDNSSFLSS